MKTVECVSFNVTNKNNVFIYYNNRVSKYEWTNIDLTLSNSSPLRMQFHYTSDRMLYFMLYVSKD
jgi:hypothetical protein